MKKSILTAFALVSFAVTGMSQASLKIEKMYHDFGEVNEGDPASYSFEVVNTGNAPLVISKVSPSCGCTTPDWTKEPIMPGAKGSITASYGTKGRPGIFNKSITVYSNDTEKPSFTMYIRGNVNGTPAPTYTSEQLKTSPKIVLEKNEHNFGKVEKNTKVPYKLSVTNLGRSDLKISEINSACNCVQIQSKPDYIKSGETAYVQLLYAPNNTGIVQDVINIKTNDLTKPTAKFTLSGNVVESMNNSLLKESNSAVPFK